MPTYEYECQKCRKVMEIFQSISAPKKTKCPECGGRLKRLLGTGSGVIFKGSGFYQTDYRSENYKSGEKADKSSSSNSAAAATPAASSSEASPKSSVSAKSEKPQSGKGKSAGKKAASD